MQEIFNANIPVLYERILGNQVLLTVAQHFLANASKSRYFADTLLRFLVDRLEQLGDADKLSSAVTVRRRWAGGAGRVRGHGRLTVTLQFPGAVAVERRVCIAAALVQAGLWLGGPVC